MEDGKIYSRVPKALDIDGTNCKKAKEKAKEKSEATNSTLIFIEKKNMEI